MTKKALSFPLSLRRVGKYSILELFHGPTMAFKDVAACVLAQLFEYYLSKNKQKITILVATSGDTGGAIAQAFSGLQQVHVVILYPRGKVSALQEEQLTRVGENVTSFAVKGDFDDCQLMIKQAFLDPELHHLNLSSANSINIGRLLPQVIYYVWAFSRLKKKALQFVVPSGNMGNVTAGVFAARMGLPFSFVIATNENDVAVNYYQTGTYQQQQTKHTLSTAMDIGNPSNFVRLLDMFGNAHHTFCQQITAVKVSDHETIATMKAVYKQDQYLLDFHTAVGAAALQKVGMSDTSSVIIATASPVKFATEIENATGIIVDERAEIAKLQKRKKRVTAVANRYESVKKALLKLQ